MFYSLFYNPIKERANLYEVYFYTSIYGIFSIIKFLMMVVVMVAVVCMCLCVTERERGG